MKEASTTSSSKGRTSLRSDRRPATAPGSGSPESSNSAKSKKRTRRRPATARTKAQQHPTLQEEEEEALEESLALAERLGLAVPEAMQSTDSSMTEDEIDLGDGLDRCSILIKKADELRDSAKSITEAFYLKENSLRSRVGSVLVEKKSKPKDLVTEWDKKLKGCVNKIDFRAGVRSLGFKANNSEVDALFDTFDGDGTYT